MSTSAEEFEPFEWTAPSSSSSLLSTSSLSIASLPSMSILDIARWGLAEVDKRMFMRLLFVQVPHSHSQPISTFASTIPEHELVSVGPTSSIPISSIERSGLPSNPFPFPSLDLDRGEERDQTCVEATNHDNSNNNSNNSNKYNNSNLDFCESERERGRFWNPYMFNPGASLVMEGTNENKQETTSYKEFVKKQAYSNSDSSMTTHVVLTTSKQRSYNRKASKVKRTSEEPHPSTIAQSSPPLSPSSPPSSPLTSTSLFFGPSIGCLSPLTSPGSCNMELSALEVECDDIPRISNLESPLSPFFTAIKIPTFEPSLLSEEHFWIFKFYDENVVHDSHDFIFGRMMWRLSLGPNCDLHKMPMQQQLRQLSKQENNWVANNKIDNSSKGSRGSGGSSINSFQYNNTSMTGEGVGGEKRGDGHCIISSGDTNYLALLLRLVSPSTASAKVHCTFKIHSHPVCHLAEENMNSTFHTSNESSTGCTNPGHPGHVHTASAAKNFIFKSGQTHSNYRGCTKFIQRDHLMQGGFLSPSGGVVISAVMQSLVDRNNQLIGMPLGDICES